MPGMSSKFSMSSFPSSESRRGVRMLNMAWVSVLAASFLASTVASALNSSTRPSRLTVSGPVRPRASFKEISKSSRIFGTALIRRLESKRQVSSAEVPSASLPSIQCSTWSLCSRREVIILVVISVATSDAEGWLASEEAVPLELAASWNMYRMNSGSTVTIS